MTKKILLISDDFSALQQMQVDLMKVGLDVQTSSSEKRLQDQLMAFPADALVAFGRGDPHLALRVGRKLRELGKSSIKVILILPADILAKEKASLAPLLAEVRMDLLWEEPIMQEKLLRGLAHLLNLDASILVGKFQRRMAVLPEDAAPGREKWEEKFKDRHRMEKYQPFLSLQIDKSFTSHSRAELRSTQAELKKSWDFKFLAVIDELKREFVKALLRKAS
ncbi:MAG: hypothetical protein WCH11_05400 [Bdellovibrio sp.]